jgi:hypothetical protein
MRHPFGEALVSACGRPYITAEPWLPRWSPFITEAIAKKSSIVLTKIKQDFGFVSSNAIDVLAIDGGNGLIRTMVLT